MDSVRGHANTTARYAATDAAIGMWMFKLRARDGRVNRASQVCAAARDMRTVQPMVKAPDAALVDLTKV
jgi:hypothetical protein